MVYVNGKSEPPDTGLEKAHIYDPLLNCVARGPRLTVYVAENMCRGLT